MKKIQRSHDNLYLKEFRYFKKPKYLTKFFFNLIKKKKFRSLLDIGCSNGSFLKYISSKIPSAQYLGTDTNQNLIKFARKMNKNIRFIKDDITKENKKKLKADIVHSAGVINIFDDVENTLRQMIARCSSEGLIYITHYFNDYDVDYITRYRDNSNLKSKKIDEMGWNVFSKKTISRILKKNKKVLKFKFLEIEFPKTLVLKKNRNDYMRSWSTIYKGKKYFVNGLNFFNKLYFLEIKLKKF